MMIIHCFFSGFFPNIGIHKTEIYIDKTSPKNKQISIKTSPNTSNPQVFKITRNTTKNKPKFAGKLQGWHWQHWWWGTAISMNDSPFSKFCKFIRPLGNPPEMSRPDVAPVSSEISVFTTCRPTHAQSNILHSKYTDKSEY